MSFPAFFSSSAKNSVVPDLAIVPKDFSSSSLLIPIPLSLTVRVLSFLFARIWIFKSSVPTVSVLLVKERNRLLSRASLLLEISSLRKISFSEYSELITILRTRPVSASKAFFIEIFLSYSVCGYYVCIEYSVVNNHYQFFSLFLSFRLYFRTNKCRPYAHKFSIKESK